MNRRVEHLVDGKHTLRDLVDIDRLREMLERFSRATGFTTGLVSYPDQQLLIKTGWRDACTKFHRAFPVSEVHCKQSNLELTSCLRERKTLNVSHCASGLVDGATPIIIKGAHVANLFTGQILFEKPDVRRFRDQGAEYGYDVEAYLDAIKEVPIVTEEQFKMALGFLSEVATMLAEQGANELRNRAIAQVSREGQERLRAILNSIGDGVIATDTLGRVTLLNPVAERLTGWTPEEAQGKLLTGIFTIVDVQTKLPAESPVRRVLEGGETANLSDDTVLVGRNGVQLHISASGSPIRGADGSVAGVVIAFRDVSDEYRLQKTSRELATIVEQAAEGIAVTDLDGKLWFANLAWAVMHGYESGERLVGKGLDVFHSPEQLIADIMPLNEEARRCGHCSGCVGHLHKDGTVFPTQTGVNVLRDESGEAYGFASFAQDITERKQAEEALRESEEKYRTLLQRIHAAVVVHGADTQVLTSNATAQDILGLSEDQMLGKRAVDPAWHFFLEDGTVMPPDDYPVNKVLATGKSLTDYVIGLHRPQRAAESDVWVLANADPVFDLDNKITQVVVTFMDVTERKHAEEEIAWNLAVNQALASLYVPMVAGDASIEQIAGLVLEKSRQLTRSAHGYVAEIDSATGDLVAHTLTKMMRTGCQVAGEEHRKSRFPRRADGLYSGLYGQALNTKDPFFTSEPNKCQDSIGTPEGHIAIESFLSVPVMLAGELVGQIALANPTRAYTNRDLEAVSRVAEFYALAIQRKRVDTELAEQMNEINRFNRLMVGREEKMIELKRQISLLLEREGEFRSE